MTRLRNLTCVISTLSALLQAACSAGGLNAGVGVSSDGRWVWAGNRADDTVSIIDTESLEVVKTLESPGFPYRVEYTPTTRRVHKQHDR